jgi:NAD dependent epimerase/dehydratase
MNLTGRDVLVTGAGGFIGSHLVQQLLLSGAHVRALVRYNSTNSRGFLESLPTHEQQHIQIVMGDLKDPDAVRQAAKGMDVVFHLGALVAIPYSYQNPTDVMQTNVLGSLHVAQAVRELGIPRLIHTSTSEVYGSARYVPMDETHPLQGQSPYSASKIAADKIMESFYCSYDLPVVTVRPFNSYGPRQSMRAVIPTIINQALHRDEIVLGNIDATRDFTFVEDTARAFLAAATSATGMGQVFNAGSSFEISVGELAERVKKLVCRDLPVRVADSRTRPTKSEVNRLFSDSSKAASTLGWFPLVGIDQGLQRTINWMRNHKDRYRPDEYVI